MPRFNRVVDTFTSLWETAEAVFLTDSFKQIVSAGNNLVGITLVADIPHNLVLRRVEYPVKSQGQLHNPQIGGKVAAVFMSYINYSFTNFTCKNR